MTDPTQSNRRKRLIYQAKHRGTKETDFMIGGFAEAHMADLSDAQLDRFEMLMDQPDLLLFDWISGRVPPPPHVQCDVMDLLIAFNAGVNRS